MRAARGAPEVIALLAVLVLAAAASLDYAIVRHQQAVAERSPHRAGAWSVACYAAGLLGTLAVVEVSWWLGFAEAAGLYAGNVLALRRLQAPVQPR